MPTAALRYESSVHEVESERQDTYPATAPGNVLDEHTKTRRYKLHLGIDLRCRLLMMLLHPFGAFCCFPAVHKLPGMCSMCQRWQALGMSNMRPHLHSLGHLVLTLMMS